MNGETNNTKTRLCACRLALVVGIVWGLACGVLGVITIFTVTYGHQMVEVLGSIYWGYRPDSWVGALWGLAWGFVEGFIGTLIIVGLYNGLGRCWSRCCCCCCCRAPSSQGPSAEGQ
ncbi:MAG: hypothetical protein V3U29_02225 [Phycisphaeraceae bacterium]